MGKRRRQMTGTPDVESRSSTYASDVTIDQLNTEVLTEIFCKLDTKMKACVARVCKPWQDAVYNPALWKYAAPLLDPSSLSPADLDSLKRRGIRRVLVGQCANRQKLSQLVYGLPSLETLQLTENMTTRALAEVFLEAMPSLRGLEFYADKMDGETLKFIRDNFPNLSHLSISVCHHSDVPDQVEEMPSLTDLTILHTNLNDQMLRHLSRAFPNLQRLECCLIEEVTDAGLQQLGLLKELRFLKLRCHRFPLSITSSQKLQRLQVLKIALAQIGDEQLCALAQLPELEELKISCRNISDEGWRALCWGFRKLRCLTLNDVYCGEDTEVGHLGSLLSLKKICLQSLEATQSKMKSLCYVLRHVHSMTIRRGPKITEDVMEDITDMENLKELGFLYTEIDDDALTKLAKGMAPLETLTLYKCECNLGDSLLEIAQGKKSIRALEVHMKVKSAILSQIVRKLPSLQVLRTSASAPTRRKLQRLKPGLTVDRIDDLR